MRLQLRSTEVKGRRLFLGLTQEELAQRAGLSQSLVSSIERGAAHGVLPNTIRKLAGGLECEIKDIAELQQEAS